MTFADLITDVVDWPQPGIVFKDITPLLADPVALRQVVDDLLAGYVDSGVTKVVGIEARGFLLAAPVAYGLHAGLVVVRKPDKLPRAVHTRTYDLEYGRNSLSVHQDSLAEGDRVLIVDDVLATGGTAAATVDLVRHTGATVVGVAVLLELAALDGRAALDGVPLTTLLTV